MIGYKNDPIVAAYKRMATEARYRPEAPSDGHGYITVPEDELDLDAEAAKYAAHMNTEETSRNFYIGVPDYRHLQPFAFAVEAARLMCGGAPEEARKLLRMAADDLADSKNIEWPA